MYTKDTREFVGAGGFNDADSTHKKAEIGFWLLPDYWGQGIMKEVMPAIFSYGFDVMGLNRIEGFVDHENEKCKKALQKINFQYEGTMRESEVENGRFIDVDIFARLRKDAES
ncbi:GNAT family N-acetyltransferase [Aquimarina sp. TRL1]|uniref:GNAT family N-acetyltransferase n=1 Tax=Aquimarina sp. (strain TRL1) TaxID=2736252 RepID=UPI0020CAFA7A|nr:GNAT family protein [Aquimarina sp. TRL1]